METLLQLGVIGLASLTAFYAVVIRRQNIREREARLARLQRSRMIQAEIEKQEGKIKW